MAIRNQTETCKQGKSAPVSVLQKLGGSQGGKGRHKCVICAYSEGLDDGTAGIKKHNIERCKHGKMAPIDMLIELPESQAGTGRHKCPVCAYSKGYDDGVKKLAEPLSSSGKLVETEPPAFSRRSKKKNYRGFKAKKRDYSDEENRKRLLGIAGELLVCKYERDYLINIGRSDLAQKVIHVSKDEGDGAGYDIKSYKETGDVLYIEVKTTSSNSDRTPFLMSENELDFAKRHAGNYCIYRIYNFDSKRKCGKFYKVAGNPEEKCALEATEYKVYPL